MCSKHIVTTSEDYLLDSLSSHSNAASWIITALVEETLKSLRVVLVARIMTSISLPSRFLDLLLFTLTSFSQTP